KYNQTIKRLEEIIIMINPFDIDRENEIGEIDDFLTMELMEDDDDEYEDNFDDDGDCDYE
ncbi:MAG: hypothetical protein RR957_07355, partial [Oscillospiraceae bacterium]